MSVATAVPAGRAESTSIPWLQLTRQRRKSELYAQEAPVREAWLQCRTELGAPATGRLARLATVVLKPEAVVGRRLLPALRYLDAHGFTPLLCRRVRLGRVLSHALWRFQWNKATVDRVRLHSYIGERCAALWIVLEDHRPLSRVPASVRLWALKGAVDESRRAPDSLRSVLRMKNRMLGFVHTADEPADIVRELGLFFDHGQRARVLRAMRAAATASRAQRVAAQGGRLEAQAPAHSVDIAEVIPRLRPTRLAPLLGALTSASGKRLFALDEVCAAFGPLPDERARWDFIVTAAALIEHDLPGVQPILDAQASHVVRERWQEAG